MVARLTHSIYAPHDHRLRMMGDAGVLSIDECWDYAAPVYLRQRDWVGLKAEKHPLAARAVGLGPKRLPLVPGPGMPHKSQKANPMDFARGIAEMADALAWQPPEPHVRALRPARQRDCPAPFSTPTSSALLAS